MGPDLYFRQDIKAAILAGIVLAVRCAQQTGSNVAFVTGALVMAEHQATTFCLDWPSLLVSARAQLGQRPGALLDQAAKQLTE